MSGTRDAHGNMKIHTNYSQKPERKKCLERPRRRWEDTLKEVVWTGFVCHRPGSNVGILWARNWLTADFSGRICSVVLIRWKLLTIDKWRGSLLSLIFHFTKISPDQTASAFKWEALCVGLWWTVNRSLSPWDKGCRVKYHHKHEAICPDDVTGHKIDNLNVDFANDSAVSSWVLKFDFY